MLNFEQTKKVNICLEKCKYSEKWLVNSIRIKSTELLFWVVHTLPLVDGVYGWKTAIGLKAVEYLK